MNKEIGEPGGFFEAVFQAINEDEKKHPFAYVGMIIYPINGRAEGITPIGHYSLDRQNIIDSVAEELYEQESQYAEEGLKLLAENDTVRIGRIIIQILKYPRSLKDSGGSVGCAIL